jgi:hypothetical protein
VLSSHELDRAEALADRVVDLVGGTTVGAAVGAAPVTAAGDAAGHPAGDAAGAHMAEETAVTEQAGHARAAQVQAVGDGRSEGAGGTDRPVAQGVAGPPLSASRGSPHVP